MSAITPYSVSGFLIALSSLGLGTLVLIQSPDKRMGRLWFLFSLSAGIWGIGIFFIGLIRDISLGFLIWRLTYSLGVLWIPPLFYQFTCHFLGLERPRSIRIHYAVAFIFLSRVFSSAFFYRCDVVFDSFTYVRGGPLYHVFMGWWLGLVFLSHWNMMRQLKKETPSRRNQIRYFFLATILGYIGGITTYLPKMGLDIYPWGSFAVVLYPIIMTYAILKYNLMDIRLFLKRAVLLAVVYIFLLLAVGPVLWVLHERGPFSIIEVGVTSLVLSAGPFLYALFVRRSAYFQDQTLASLTHELKSPLASIESALDVLKNEGKQSNAVALKTDYLEMIDRNSVRLRKSIEALLLAFQDQVASPQLRLVDTDIVNVITSCVASFTSDIKAKGLKLTCTLPDEPLRAQVDVDRLRMVLSNLLSNSAKFTQEGGIVLLVKKTPDHIEISVSDSGVGLSKEDAPHIFERFYQGRSGGHHKGTGVGLTIAKAWVEAHGGKIWAESEGEGRGTTVRFTVPL